MSNLPENCPVTPLGINGNDYFYIDANGQLRQIKPYQHTRLNILSLFGSQASFLYENWPSSKEPDTNKYGFRSDKAAEDLMFDCARAGVWDVLRHTRGRGTWLNHDGNLIVHAGDALLHNGEWRTPGRIDGEVYPAAPPVPRPSEHRPNASHQAAAVELSNILSTWNWRRGTLDTRLLIGWIGAAFLAGALEWRPAVWITGDKATGKSTLQNLLQGLFGDSLLASVDTSAAGITQSLKIDALPVATDEVEAESNNYQNQSIIKLARMAASGGVIRRGTSDSKGAHFFSRSCYLFSSILIPPLLPQDQSRIAILELLPFQREQTPPDMSGARLMSIGSRIHRRLIDEWARFPQTLEAYRSALMMHANHDARGADQFGTLLACADLLLEDDKPNDKRSGRFAELLQVATDEVLLESDHYQCLQHLIAASTTGGLHGPTVGQLVEKLSAAATGGVAINESFLGEMQTALARVGIRFYAEAPWSNLPEGHWMAIASGHPGAKSLFSGTHWKHTSGQTTAWRQSLLRLPGAVPSKTVKIGGVSSKAVFLPIDLVVAGFRDDEGRAFAA